MKRFLVENITPFMDRLTITGREARYINTVLRMRRGQDLIIMDGRKAFVSGGPERGELAEPGIVMASGDMVAIDVEALKVLQSYPAENRLDRDPYDLPQIATALKHGLTSGEGDYKLVE